MYKKRFYRTNTYNSDLVAFGVRHFESDLLIYAHSDLSVVSFEYLRRIHGQVSDYCQSHPEFEKSLEPVDIARRTPKIIRTMHKASIRAGVGPMASVAGAIAEAVGKKLLKYSREIIIENGGDIFFAVSKVRKIGIFAGIGNIYNQLIVKIYPDQSPCGICTSSGQFGHSLSLGKTSATIIISKSSALADGYATAFGNMVNNEDDIDFALKSARKKKDIKGIIIITSLKMAAYGDLSFDVLDK
ncbi:MAG: UPF0280 family protein [Candidatus Omnitrophica bacterium]|nr:UPF0280 family protein [Candidatus Omnitrophota bacterium]